MRIHWDVKVLHESSKPIATTLDTAVNISQGGNMRCRLSLRRPKKHSVASTSCSIPITSTFLLIFAHCQVGFEMQAFLSSPDRDSDRTLLKLLPLYVSMHQVCGGHQDFSAALDGISHAIAARSSVRLFLCDFILFYEK